MDFNMTNPFDGSRTCGSETDRDQLGRFTTGNTVALSLVSTTATAKPVEGPAKDLPSNSGIYSALPSP